MSSDEPITVVVPSNADPVKRYRRSRKCWLSQKVVDLHAEVDRRSLKYRQETFVRGSFPHLRILDDESPISKNPMAVYGLPHNIYDDRYLRMLKPDQAKMISANHDVTYSF